MGVGTLIVSTNTQRVLLNMRAPHKTHAMQWALFGGMVEKGEQPKDALMRELTEEMGFIPEIEKLYPFDVYQSRDGHFKYYSFVAVVVDEFVFGRNQRKHGIVHITLSCEILSQVIGNFTAGSNSFVEFYKRFIIDTFSEFYVFLVVEVFFVRCGKLIFSIYILQLQAICHVIEKPEAAFAALLSRIAK